MFDADHSFRLTVAGVVLLLGLGFIIAWLPARRRDPAGLSSRLLVTAGLIMGIADLGGLGSVLGFTLAAMGALITWEAQPAPEVPRPHRGGIVVAAVLAGLAALGTFEGWGSLTRVPPELRVVATLVVGVTGALATLAIADRARVRLRVAIRRRFAPVRPRPRVAHVEAGAAVSAVQEAAAGQAAMRKLTVAEAAPRNLAADEPAQPELRPRSASIAAQSPSRPSGVIRHRFAAPRLRTESSAPVPPAESAPSESTPGESAPAESAPAESAQPRGRRRVSRPSSEITVAGRSPAQLRDALTRRLAATRREAEPATETADSARPDIAEPPARPNTVEAPATETDAAPPAGPSRSKLELRRAVGRRLAASWPDRAQSEPGPRIGSAPEEPPPWAARIRAAFGRAGTTRPEPVDEPPPAAPLPVDTVAGEPTEPREDQGGPAWVRARDSLRRLTTSRLEQLGDQPLAAERWRSPSAAPPDDEGPRHDAQEVVPWARRDALQRLTVIRLERLDEEPEARTDTGRKRRNGTEPVLASRRPTSAGAPTGDVEKGEGAGPERTDTPARGSGAAVPGKSDERATSELAHDAGTSVSSWGGRLRDAVRGRFARPASDSARTESTRGDRDTAASGSEPSGAAKPAATPERPTAAVTVNGVKLPPPPPPPAARRTPVRVVGVPPGTPPPPPPPAD
ncbi:hypothetical protein E1262_15075 [Jiangella aurantiaca]|uniref:Uncharacterized protein n=1 Tax=Jiangella aurantiaca TaxID=2530373 RepID=A0A4R5A915_9ACTN|nr:hypothetical protein [Jiangella aurantiaca]TDD68778.1 hypothetical protein E1262_15075 [Jiangella aurantiaca]